MLDNSTVFELLSATTRQQLLFALCDSPDVHALEDLQTRGQAHPQHSGGGASVHPQLRQARTIQSQHTHLPKLEAAGVIEWDRDTWIVSRGLAFAEIGPFLPRTPTCFRTPLPDPAL